MKSLLLRLALLAGIVFFGEFIYSLIEHTIRPIASTHLGLSTVNGGDVEYSAYRSFQEAIVTIRFFSVFGYFAAAIFILIIPSYRDIQNNK